MPRCPVTPEIDEMLTIDPPFACVISAAIFLPSASSMSATTTLAPSRAKIRAMLAPIPDAAPVISATLFSSLIVPPSCSVHPDRRAHRIADRFVHDAIGHLVERRRLAVDDDKVCAVVLGELRKSCRGI